MADESPRALAPSEGLTTRPAPTAEIGSVPISSGVDGDDDDEVEAGDEVEPSLFERIGSLQLFPPLLLPLQAARRRPSQPPSPLE